jgi:hypothetical protein
MIIMALQLKIGAGFPTIRLTRLKEMIQTVRKDSVSVPQQ